MFTLKKRIRLTIAVALAAALPGAANALLISDVDALGSYAGIATVTVTKASPGGSGKGDDTSTFGLAWTAGGSSPAYASAVAPGLAMFIVDFHSVFPGNAPTSLRWGRFSLDYDQAPLTLDDFGFDGTPVGDVPDVVALARAAADYGAWEVAVSQAAFDATYRLFLFDPAGGAGPVQQTPVAVPEPGLLALLGIGLGGLALCSRRSRA